MDFGHGKWARGRRLLLEGLEQRLALAALVVNDIGDVDADPTEQQNQAATHPEKVAALTQQWHDCAQRCDVIPPAKKTPPRPLTLDP